MHADERISAATIVRDCLSASVLTLNTRVTQGERQKRETLRCERECCPRDTVIGLRSVQSGLPCASRQPAVAEIVVQEENRGFPLFSLSPGRQPASAPLRPPPPPTPTTRCLLVHTLLISAKEGNRDRWIEIEIGREGEERER